MGGLLNYNGSEREYSMVCVLRNTACLILGDVLGINCWTKVGGLVGVCAHRRTVLQDSDSRLPFRRIDVDVGVGVGVGFGFVSKGRWMLIRIKATMKVAKMNQKMRMQQWPRRKQ